MIVLDTNVVSERLRPVPGPSVVNWLAAHDDAPLWSVLPFDDLAAAAYPDIMARSRRAGLAIGIGDGQIAAIALSRGASVATRDTAPFAAVGVPVINPWLAA